MADYDDDKKYLVLYVRVTINGKTEILFDDYNEIPAAKGRTMLESPSR